jgi:transcriptional regulator with XRE-family HTH domain
LRRDPDKELHPINISMGKLIRRRRVKLSISQEELAEKASLHRTYINEIENGLRSITLLTFHRICKGLNIDDVKMLHVALEEAGDVVEAPPAPKKTPVKRQPRQKQSDKAPRPGKVEKTAPKQKVAVKAAKARKS